MKTMNDLFLHVLKDIYYAEKQSASRPNYGGNKKRWKRFACS